MPTTDTKPHKRVNVTLSPKTLELLDRVATKGSRSGLIDRAVRHYVTRVGLKTLRRRVREGAIARADRDQAIAAEWFTLEEETWPKQR